MKLVFRILLSAVLSAASLCAFAQNPVKVRGVVVSEDDGLPLIGAGVVAGPGQGTITDFDGNYEIEVAAGTRLEFSCIGFISQTVNVPSGVSEFKCDVVLRTESIKLEDAVVIAYGVRKKGTVAGSVATVKSEKL